MPPKAETAIRLQGPLQGLGGASAPTATPQGLVCFTTTAAGFGVGAVAELPHGGQGRIEVEQVVEAELLALQLAGPAPARAGLAVPAGLLVGVLAVAQGLAQGQLQPQGKLLSTAAGLQLLRQPGADGAVVAGGVAEGLQGEPAAQGGIDLDRPPGPRGSRAYWPGSVSTATSAWFLAAARTMAGPPMSIVSTAVSQVTAGSATVSRKG